MIQQEQQSHLGTHGYRSTVIAATCLGIIWFGDAVIYVVLPLYAPAFGCDVLMVGVLLSVNRVVRILGYGWVGPLARAYGSNVLTAVACAAGAVSTLAYGVRWEAQGNGNINWDEGFEILIRFLRTHLLDAAIYPDDVVKATKAIPVRLAHPGLAVVEDEPYDELGDRVVEWYRHSGVGCANTSTNDLSWLGGERRLRGQRRHVSATVEAPLMVRNLL